MSKIKGRDAFSCCHQARDKLIVYTDEVGSVCFSTSTEQGVSEIVIDSQDEVKRLVGALNVWLEKGDA